MSNLLLSLIVLWNGNSGHENATPAFLEFLLSKQINMKICSLQGRIQRGFSRISLFESNLPLT